jgi:hypothetical protein
MLVISICFHVRCTISVEQYAIVHGPGAGMLISDVQQLESQKQLLPDYATTSLTPVFSV